MTDSIVVTREPGEQIPTIYEASEVFGPGAVVVAPAMPDFVRVPPEMTTVDGVRPGDRCDVDDIRVDGACPSCRGPAVRVWSTTHRGTGTAFVIFETTCCGFLWTTPPEGRA